LWAMLQSARLQAGREPDDPHNLRRFSKEQSQSFDKALQEIRRGRKVSCWMWFVIPTPPYIVNGLEHGSSTNMKYSLRTDEESHSFLKFEADGVNLRNNYIDIITAVRDQLQCGTSAKHLMGPLDEPKLASSVRHFHRISDEIDDTELCELCAEVLLLLKPVSPGNTRPRTRSVSVHVRTASQRETQRRHVANVSRNLSASPEPRAVRNDGQKFRPRQADLRQSSQAALRDAERPYSSQRHTSGARSPSRTAVPDSPVLLRQNSSRPTRPVRSGSPVRNPNSVDVQKKTGDESPKEARHMNQVCAFKEVDGRQGSRSPSRVSPTPQRPAQSPVRSLPSGSRLTKRPAERKTPHNYSKSTLSWSLKDRNDSGETVVQHGRRGFRRTSLC